MPQMGETVTEGTITAWLKSPGDTIDVDEPLLEISTEKVDSEIPSPVAGIVAEVLVPEGDTVPIGEPLARITTDGPAPEPDPETDPDERRPPPATAGRTPRSGVLILWPATGGSGASTSSNGRRRVPLARCAEAGRRARGGPVDHRRHRAGRAGHP